ncbi:MAG: biopolymer transporter ExbD [Nitrospiraceae bacterium]|nr:biopolymer transporter ExbD [Nitrospiraceae bacterium]
MDEKEFDYMNVIPLVDVMLVLLTIVLTTSTFIATGVIPVELPRAAKTNEAAMRTQTIEIDRTGSVFLNAKPVRLEDLRDAICSLNRSVLVLIRADREVGLQAFVDVLDVVKNLGFQKVSLQTEVKR